MFMQDVRNYITTHEMLRENDRVLVGLSGGADSVCLLRVLCSLREEMALSLLAVHVHHGIRGESADADAAFCEELCKQLSVSFRLIRADIPLLAVQTGQSEEEAGRTFRYQCFERIRREEGYDRIAAAHHADDNAETMLLQLCRGTGLAGLCGIPPVRGALIRPLLCVRRAEIEAYLNEAGQDWRTDETNADDRYRRNRIRHHVMPVLEEINPRAVSNMNRTSQILRRTEEYIRTQTQEALAKCMHGSDEGEECCISIPVFETFDPLIRERVLLAAVTHIADGTGDIAQVHLEALEVLTHRQSGRGIDLPGGLKARREYDTLRIFRLQEAGQNPEAAYCFDAALLMPGWETAVSCSGTELSLSVLDAAETDPSDLKRENPYTKFLNCDKINRSLCIRTCRPQDRICVDAEGHHKSMRRYLMDEKVPQAQRTPLVVTADDDQVLWAVGGRIGYEYRIDADTQRILKVSILGQRRETDD